MKRKLGDIASITMGQSPSSDTYNSSEGLPFFQGNADFGKLYPTVRIYCNAPIRIANPNDILISVRAPIGAINIADRECCIGRGLAAIDGSPLVSNKFIFYFLNASKDKLIAQGTGSTFKSIGKDALHNLQFPVPSLPEQERIVAELDLLSGIIEKQKAQLRELDTLAQSIFDSSFKDALYSSPKTTLEEVADYFIGLTYKPENVSEEGTIVLRSSNIQENRLDFKDIVRVNSKVDAKKIVKDGDILMAEFNLTVQQHYQV